MIISFAFVLLSSVVFSQKNKAAISFYSSDSLLITADEYIANDSLPYIVMFHEQNSSRGEYDKIAKRFQKMNYNILAVDIRNGGNSNYIGNETAKRCREKGLSRSAKAVEADILSGINYAYDISERPVILLGAGANGSLALKACKEQEKVRACIALSPGEFFMPGLSIEDTISGLEKPILVTSSKLEFPYVNQLVSKVPDTKKTVFSPENLAGARGTSALLPENDSNGDYWLAILFFFKDLQ